MGNNPLGINNFQLRPFEESLRNTLYGEKAKANTPSEESNGFDCSGSRAFLQNMGIMGGQNFQMNGLHGQDPSNEWFPGRKGQQQLPGGAGIMGANVFGNMGMPNYAQAFLGGQGGNALMSGGMMAGGLGAPQIIQTPMPQPAQGSITPQPSSLNFTAKEADPEDEKDAKALEDARNAYADLQKDWERRAGDKDEYGYSGDEAKEFVERAAGAALERAQKIVGDGDEKALIIQQHKIFDGIMKKLPSFTLPEPSAEQVAAWEKDGLDVEAETTKMQDAHREEWTTDLTKWEVEQIEDYNAIDGNKAVKAVRQSAMDPDTSVKKKAEPIEVEVKRSKGWGKKVSEPSYIITKAPEGSGLKGGDYVFYKADGTWVKASSNDSTTARIGTEIEVLKDSPKPSTDPNATATLKMEGPEEEAADTNTDSYFDVEYAGVREIVVEEGGKKRTVQAEVYTVTGGMLASGKPVDPKSVNDEVYKVDGKWYADPVTRPDVNTIKPFSESDPDSPTPKHAANEGRLYFNRASARHLPEGAMYKDVRGHIDTALQGLEKEAAEKKKIRQDRYKVFEEQFKESLPEDVQDLVTVKMDDDGTVQITCSPEHAAQVHTAMKREGEVDALEKMTCTLTKDGKPDGVVTKYILSPVPSSGPLEGTKYLYYDTESEAWFTDADALLDVADLDVKIPKMGEEAKTSVSFDVDTKGETLKPVDNKKMKSAFAALPDKTPVRFNDELMTPGADPKAALAKEAHEAPRVIHIDSEAMDSGLKAAKKPDAIGKVLALAVDDAKGDAKNLESINLGTIALPTKKDGGVITQSEFEGIIAKIAKEHDINPSQVKYTIKDKTAFKKAEAPTGEMLTTSGADFGDGVKVDWKLPVETQKAFEKDYGKIQKDADARFKEMKADAKNPSPEKIVELKKRATVEAITMWAYTYAKERGWEGHEDNEGEALSLYDNLSSDKPLGECTERTAFLYALMKHAQEEGVLQKDLEGVDFKFANVTRVNTQLAVHKDAKHVALVATGAGDDMLCDIATPYKTGWGLGSPDVTPDGHTLDKKNPTMSAGEFAAVQLYNKALIAQAKGEDPAEVERYHRMAHALSPDIVPEDMPGSDKKAAAAITNGVSDVDDDADASASKKKPSAAESDRIPAPPGFQYNDAGQLIKIRRLDV